MTLTNKNKQQELVQCVCHSVSLSVDLKMTTLIEVGQREFLCMAIGAVEGWSLALAATTLNSHENVVGVNGKETLNK